MSPPARPSPRLLVPLLLLLLLLLLLKERRGAPYGPVDKRAA